MSRRLNGRTRRAAGPGGGIGGGSVAISPATILGSKATEWWRSDLGIVTETGVASWTGQILGLDFLQATADSQPGYVATGGPNSRPSVLTDGVDDFMDGDALVRTQPQTVILIARQVSWALNDSIVNDANAGLIIFQRTVSPTLAQSSGVVANNNVAAVVGEYKRIQGEFRNTTEARLLIGATDATGAATGATGGTQPLIGRNAGSTTFGHAEYCEIILVNGIPSASENSALDAYFKGLYGATVLAG